MLKAKKAVILLSGGLDSATVLAIAQQQGYTCHALSMEYGQRHMAELGAARRVAQSMDAAEHKMVRIGLETIGGSALTDSAIPVPDHAQEGIPVTYVPARNTVFLSLALGWAEVLGAQDIFIGVNAVDYSGYPDCRPEFIHSFEKLANLATKAGVEGERFKVHTPLIDMSKAEIISTGIHLGVDYSLTISCYQADPEGRACGVCDSCRLRAKGFQDAAIDDPTSYRR
ncbi:MAG: 7-cyano-7-deazaguanine synthase QueC [gamma proteobacterium endosymbiont of Lamellibrachia anaximandri]|nr:7-cyano-7-deazaguanine synthase QueC [gamma proteobacterium endosymbiont of Lamellibrachia anaximandri]MBL3532476.1 7-cyano-7-deazaguanine synthase QueC [gamma proteobacterium endosymbiont of Lamellibrachia anaximandri]MBL3600462.1 7-cyano-7-deazaguanine synthase QueC [gamma proteobacterium endosymbiont of Lamellibrachia anaximandri]